MASKAWYTYPRIDNFGQYPDPDGAFPKPDSNIQCPNGTVITCVGSGVVSGIDIPGGSEPAYGHAVTILLDNPHNALATHDAYIHLASVSVTIGQRVAFGGNVGVSGANPQNAAFGFAFYPGDLYGQGPEWNKYIQTSSNTIDPRLNPVPFLDGLASQGNGQAVITLRAFIDQAINDLKMKVNGGTGLFQVGSQKIIDFVTAWAHVEGGGVTNACSFNILNTMQAETGSVQCPGTLPGIQQYPDDATGIKALVDALTNGRYPNIVHAITTNDENNLGFNQHPMANNIAQELSMWVSGSRLPLQQSYILSIMESAGIGGAFITGGMANGGNPATQSQIDSWANQSLGPDTSGITVGGAGGNLTAVNTFFSQLSGFFSNPVRLIKIIGGATLVIVGLVLLVKSFVPAKTIAKAATLAA